MKEYWIENREELKKRSKNWWISNPERKSGYDKKYRIKNPEYNKEWNAKNPTYCNEWRVRNPEKVREYSLRRRINGIVEKGVITQIVSANILKYGIMTCEACEGTCKDNYHIDNIIPISKSGNNYYDNLQILCANCNHRKFIDIKDYR